MSNCYLNSECKNLINSSNFSRNLCIIFESIKSILESNEDGNKILQILMILYN
ncbi:15294_t:CDS:1, partial [Funneliformis geosporum]